MSWSSKSNLSNLRKRVFAAAMVATVACLAAGCGPVDRSCSVAGQVLVNTQPAAGAYVLLKPLSAQPAATDATSMSPASARTDDDGTFTLKVPAPGEYVVNVFWPKVLTTPDEIVEGEDRLLGKYRDPAKPVATVSIHEGTNPIAPLELKYP